MASSREETLKSALFGKEAIRFEIPKYQRAYSWGRDQWKQFLQDLKDAESGYYLGHYLFETHDDVCFVIDGQQRLTTCVIFISAALDILAAYEEYRRDVNIWRRRYLLDAELGPRLKTVPYDNPLFQSFIVDGDCRRPSVFNTQSEKNIVEAKEYFVQELRKAEAPEKIAILVRRMENAVITTYEVMDRGMAARIFAFQNDRGKPLTQLETIKSFLMMTVYMKGKNEEEKNSVVDEIDTRFAHIYETIMRINVDEDDVLLNYWRSRNGFYADDAIVGAKNELSKAEDQISWIKAFVRDLASAFSFVEVFEKDGDEYPVRLRLLNNMACSYPFFIRAWLKGIKYDSPLFVSLMHLMENLTFRSLIRGGRADIQTRLNDHLKRISDEASAKVEIGKMVEAIVNGWWGYWSDAEVERRLNEWFYGNRVDNYLLWQYERSLYDNGYVAPVSAKEMMKNESIEHIAPQTETGGDAPANGYGEYDIKESPENGIVSGGWLNCLGNLVLASQSQNSSIGNKPFAEKLDDYGRGILQQQKKIDSYAEIGTDGSKMWTVGSIKQRQERIVKWALTNWDVRKVIE
ncbi:MAG: DUF262 domain-containing protein [Victivallales bacterium]|nr:DUF262 domain-containing protein [Victivallales bacterium]